jgi:protein arginine kinase activator
MPEAPSSSAESVASCPNCGITFEQFKKQSLLGCPEDYAVFEKQLEPIVKKSQGGHGEHCGKVPEKSSDETKKNTELIRLRQELELAVQVEDYELAAKVRDRIKQLQ